MPVDLQALYSVPPEEFVDARTAMVKALKAAKELDAAAALHKLRRPKVAEHALNLAARSEPEVVSDWVAAVTALDQAQSTAIGGGGADHLREASAALRSTHAALLAAAVAQLGDGGAAQRDAISSMLRTLAHPEGVALMRAGLVGSEQLTGLEMFAGAPEPVVRRSAPSVAPVRARRATPDAPAPTPTPKVDLRKLRALERAQREAHAEQARADAALVAARAAVQAAKDALAVATTRAADARAAARAADSALEALT